MQTNALALVPTLTVIDGKPTTTSIDVARHFGKSASVVNRAIRNLLIEMPEGYACNFAPIQIAVDLGMGRTRQDPAYRLTRDGFTLLAMGFTGKEALQWKIAYINAFNQMEAQLNQTLSDGRWFVSIQNGHKRVQKIAHDMGIFRYEELPELIKDPDQMIGADLLAAIGQACIQRLHQKFSGLKHNSRQLALM
jgi:Rha family phage regulatory protein